MLINSNLSELFIHIHIQMNSLSLSRTKMDRNLKQDKWEKPNKNRYEPQSIHTQTQNKNGFLITNINEMQINMITCKFSNYKHTYRELNEWNKWREQQSKWKKKQNNNNKNEE